MQLQYPGPIKILLQLFSQNHLFLKIITRSVCVFSKISNSDILFCAVGVLFYIGVYSRVGLSDFIDTAIYIDILFPDKVSTFFFFFKQNLLKSQMDDSTISTNGKWFVLNRIELNRIKSYRIVGWMLCIVRLVYCYSPTPERILMPQFLNTVSQ